MRCVVEVADGGRSCLFHQCLNKRGHGKRGDLCGIHAKREFFDLHISIPEIPGREPAEGRAP